VWIEHLPSKEAVEGSNPSALTQSFTETWGFFFWTKPSLYGALQLEILFLKLHITFGKISIYFKLITILLHICHTYATHLQQIGPVCFKTSGNLCEVFAFDSASLQSGFTYENQTLAIVYGFFLLQLYCTGVFNCLFDL
jgi:hypothetical protein